MIDYDVLLNANERLKGENRTLESKVESLKEDLIGERMDLQASKILLRIEETKVERLESDDHQWKIFSAGRYEHKGMDGNEAFWKWKKAKAEGGE